MMTVGTLEALMTTGNFEIPSFISVTEEEPRKAKQLYNYILHYFRNEVEKVTVFFKPNKTHIFHFNICIGWFKVESKNYLRDLTFSQYCL